MNNIFHIFIIAVLSWKLMVAFSAAALYKIFKMLYGVNKLLSTALFPLSSVKHFFVCRLEETHLLSLVKTFDRIVSFFYNMNICF